MTRAGLRRACRGRRPIADLAHNNTEVPIMTKILIVDEDNESREGIAQALRDAFPGPSKTFDIKELCFATDVQRENGKFDLIVTAWEMASGQSDGLEVVQIMKKSGPVVVVGDLTGFDTRSVKDAGPPAVIPPSSPVKTFKAKIGPILSLKACPPAGARKRPRRGGAAFF